MKSFGLWLLSVTLLGITLGCGEKTDKPATPPADTPPADTPADPAP